MYSTVHNVLYIIYYTPLVSLVYTEQYSVQYIVHCKLQCKIQYALDFTLYTTHHLSLYTVVEPNYVNGSSFYSTGQYRSLKCRVYGVQYAV